MRKEIATIGLRKAAATKVATVSLTMTLISVERGKVKVKAAEKESVEEAQQGTKVKTPMLVDLELLLALLTEHVVIPGPQEELRTATSGVRGVLLRNPVPHLVEGLAHRMVLAFPHLLLLLPQEQNLKK